MKTDCVFLFKAIKECKNISIIHKPKDKQKTVEYFSRFFKLQSDEKSIAIDFPYMDGYAHKPLLENDPISVFFHIAGFRFHFDSKVKKETHFTLKDGTKIPVLTIAYPEEILDGNRRSLFRMAVHLDKSVKVKYVLLGKEKNDITDAKARSNGGEYEGIEAMMIDISANGLAVEIKRKINIKIGDRLKLRFQLEEEDKKDIEIEGIARNIREIPGSDIHLCGIEFTQDKTTKYKKALQKIVYYIMSRNRENVTFFTVNQIVSTNPIVQGIVDNEVTEGLLKMVLSKELLLTQEEYLESLVYVIKIEKFKDQASEMLESIPLSIKERYIEKADANHRVAYYILQEAINNSNLKIIAGIINNSYLPVEFLLEIAEKGTARMVRMLMANDIKLITFPEIMEAMEENPNTPTSIKKKIQNLKESHLKEEEAEYISVDEVMEGVTGLIAVQDEEEEGITEFLQSDEFKEKALTTLQKINQLSLQERIKLAFTGSKSERMVLARDRNKFIALALIESPKISEEEVLVLTKNRSAPKEVIAKICENKNWTRNYTIMLSLLKNPKIPIIKAPGFIKKLNQRDLFNLSLDKNVHPVIRNLARYFYGKRK
jgi:c-di-GMP-binding flagellar brake protein YcgR